MPSFQSIQPGSGLGSIRFGIGRATLKSILGDPDEILDSDDIGDPDDSYVIWHYDDHELSVTFDEADDWRLTTISVTSPRYELDGKALIGMSKSAIMELIREKGYGTVYYEDCSSVDNPGQELIEVAEMNMTFWFDNAVLSEVQWSSDN